ncbi:hypothetical protein [Paracoccus sp. (in: a-proteobacteria)]|uniref:hypothetical protein n=1 Tax=Paracoccus sp. TaxID=267 RepID=UPI00272957A6|nr:hypothetical protein [Paracoccus sp. (in: a-proteobacteria)]
MRRGNSRINKAHFLVYSNGVDPFATNAQDYCDAALAVGFDSAEHVTEAALRQTPFWEENRFILEQPRGAGYWLWKPWIILQKLRECGPDDIVIYNDAGRYEKGAFRQFPSFPHAAVELCAMTPNRFIHGFIGAWQVQGEYTKRDAFVLMGADTDEMLRAAQVCAGPLLFMPSEASFAFLEKWVEFCRDPRALTDQPDELAPTHPQFRDHRHDQSIGSILAHQTGAHYFDFSDTGVVNASEDVRQRNRHVPRLHTHIGYVSLIAGRALPDDFFVRPDADILEARPLLRNLTSGEPLPLHAEKTPDAVLTQQILSALATPGDRIGIDHLRFLIGENRITNSRMHILQKLGHDLNGFWKEAIDHFSAAADAVHASGQAPGFDDARKMAVHAIRKAEESAPQWRKDVMAGFLWSMLDDEARRVFKTAHKGIKSPAGVNAMYRFAQHLEQTDLLSLETELAGDDRKLRPAISQQMMAWIIQPAAAQAR